MSDTAESATNGNGAVTSQEPGAVTSQEPDAVTSQEPADSVAGSSSVARSSSVPGTNTVVTLKVDRCSQCDEAVDKEVEQAFRRTDSQSLGGAQGRGPVHLLSKSAPNSRRSSPTPSTSSHSYHESLAEEVRTLDLEKRGITLPPHLRTGTPILSGVKSRTSFKMKKKRFSVTKKYTEEWTVIKPTDGEHRPPSITNGMSSTSGETSGSDSAEYRGWLLKWTNYIKGYRQRWFVLSDGLLSYYRSQAEMAHTCRGTINLAGASLESEDSCNFVISNGGAQVFHLRARSEVDRQRWITALELAKDRANKMRERVDDEEDFVVSPETTATALRQKLDHLNTCQNLVNQHGLALQQAISQIEDSAKLKSLIKDPLIAHLIKKTAEFRVASSSMIKACSTFVTYAAHHEKEWQMAREQRERLEETVESLARQHMSLENAMNKSKRNLSDMPQDRPPGEGVVGIFDSDEDDDDFYDAMDHSASHNSGGYHTPEANNGTAVTVPSPKMERDVQPPSHSKSSLSTRTTSRKRRLRIPDKPNDKANLWNIMKNCIGKELSKIPMPVNFNEPISFLQRLTEDMEYGDLLSKAAECSTVEESLTYLSAIAVSSYATTSSRTSKPFNPLLGETFEYDRSDDLGWRSFAEQVSHHPPVSALHVEHDDWTYYQDFSMTSKFRGKYLQVFPIGTTHFIVKSTGHHYTWNKVCTTVHNIIVGKLWVDQSGEIVVKEHETGASARVKFHPYSYFSRETPRRVTGGVFAPDGTPQFDLQGTWDNSMSCAEVISADGDAWGTREHQTRWVKNATLEEAEKIYHFTAMAVTLNEPEEGVAPTDARNRPDQRLMENQNFPAANSMKVKLEEAQRARRRAREARIAAEGPSAKYIPKWFEKKKCEITGEEIWRFTDEYWKCKETQTWDRCPVLYIGDGEET